MRHLKQYGIKFGVPALAIAFAVGGPSVSAAESGAIAYAEACAEDGSCGPAPAYVCGLNGKNYSEKVYIPAQD